MDTHSWPADLVESLQAGNVVPFVGAGLSVPSGLPSWRTLLETVVEQCVELGLPQVREQFHRGMITSIDAPELHQALHGGRFQLLDYVTSRYGQPAQPNSYHSLLSELRVDTILTTNYDKLIERHFEARGDAVHTVWREYHISQYSERNALQIVKLHGHIDDPESIVLSRREYERYIQDHPLLYALASILFTTRTILFLGCSLSDPNITGLLRDLRRRTSEFTRSHYVLMYVPTPSDVSAIRSLGLQVIECSGHTHEEAVESWLGGLVRRAQVVARDNEGKSRMINAALRNEVAVGLPGATIRMRAAMGIVSNPKSIPEGTIVYGSSAQDVLEIEMGALAREFLRKHVRNRIRTIVHVDPLIQLRKAFTRGAIQLRLHAMSEFLDEFGERVEIAQAENPVGTNHVIVSDKISFLAFKNAGNDIGYKATRVTRNRWTVRSESEAFDSDFYDVLTSNRARAAELGIDTNRATWTAEFMRAIISTAMEMLSEHGTVLRCDELGAIIEPVDRAYAHEAGIRHRSVHLSLFSLNGGRLSVLLQRRAHHQSLYPGMISVAVTGHPESAEMTREVLRECSEELGFWLDPTELSMCGTFERRAGTDIEVVTLFRADVSGRTETIPRNVCSDVDALYWVDVEGLLNSDMVPAVVVDRMGSQWRRGTCSLSRVDVIPGTLEEVALAAGCDPVRSHA